MENNHPVLSKMNEYIKDLEAQATGLNQDNLGMAIRRNEENENIRLILLEAIAEDVDVQTLANSVADVLGISLLREISVTFNVAVEATMLVPADFDVSDFDVTDVRMEAWNSEVEDFSVESFEISDVEEA
jgi:hypothetical protein